MAQKRMFSLSVVDTDKFMDMSTSAQALYFHLGMRGDDDGFVSSPRKIARAAGCNDDDLKLLAAKGYIIPFENGVVVITDWRLNNTLKNDRYKGTLYQKEKAKLTVDSEGRYLSGTILEPEWNQSGSKMEPQLNLTELNLTEHRLVEYREGVSGETPKPDKPATTQKSTRFVKPLIDEADAYFTELGKAAEAQRFFDYYEANGWRVGRGPMKDWRAAARNWARNADKFRPPALPNSRQTATDALDRAAKRFEDGDFSLLEGVLP